MRKQLIMVGGGGHCKSVIDVAECAGWKILGILDMPEKIGEKVLNYEIIGSDNEISKWVDKALFVVTVGYIKDSTLRVELFNKIKEVNGELATIISPIAHVSKYAHVGEGSVIMHQAIVNADAKIGNNCIINTFANIEHDSIIESNCHISTGTMVNGNCQVGENTFMGSQAVMVNGISITSGCLIGAGAMVRKNITIKGMYSGNPAILKLKL